MSIQIQKAVRVTAIICHLPGSITQFYLGKGNEHHRLGSSGWLSLCDGISNHSWSECALRVNSCQEN